MSLIAQFLMKMFVKNIFMKAADLNFPYGLALYKGGWPNARINWFKIIFISDVYYTFSEGTQMKIINTMLLGTLIRRNRVVGFKLAFFLLVLNLVTLRYILLAINVVYCTSQLLIPELTT